MRAAVLDNLCKDLLAKYKDNRVIEKPDLEYKTPIYSKNSSHRFESSTTIESEAQIYEPKMNREKIGEDLKLQWSQMMEEFEEGTKKQLINLTPH